MLPKRHRLQKQKDIDDVYKARSKAHGRFLSVFVRKTNEQPSRATVVVSKKVSKKATERNSLKRQVREHLRTEVQADGWDILVSMRPGAKEATREQLQDETTTLIQQAKTGKRR